jgi:TonB family protein
MRLVRSAVGVALWCGLLSATVVADDKATTDSLTVARELYSAAEYESALGMLDRLRTGTRDADAVAPIEQYRAFCLLALGRPSDAEQAMAAVVKADPAFTLTDPGLSPRLRTAFREVRGRTLPQVIQDQYDAAKAAFDRREFAPAAVGFAGVLRLLADPDVAAQSGSGPLADIAKLAGGFRDLSVAASAPPPPPPASMPPAPSQPPVAVPTVFSADDGGVVAPVAVKQVLPAFQMQTTGATQGVLEIVIDERGFVQSAIMRSSINSRYDRLVLDAARTWRYQPATRQGVPVRYRKLVQIVVRKEK